MFEEKFWTAVAFFVLVFMAFRPVQRLLIKFLDAHTAKTLERLNNAKTMYEQAQKALSEAKIKIDRSKHEADLIIKHAQEQAEAILQESIKEIESMAAKKTDLLMQKVSGRQQQMVQTIKDQVVIDVMHRVHKRMLEELHNESQAQATEAGIKALNQLVH